MDEEWNPKVPTQEEGLEVDPLAAADNVPELQPLEVNAAEVARLDAQISGLAEQEKKLRARRALVEEALKAQFAEAGVQNINVLGRTVYLYRAVYVEMKEGVTPDQVIAALDGAGIGDVLAPRTLQRAKLEALAREWRDASDGLEEVKPPEYLEGLLAVGELHKVRSKKG